MDTLSVAFIAIGAIVFMPLLVAICGGISARRRAARRAAMMDRFWTGIDGGRL